MLRHKVQLGAVATENWFYAASPNNFTHILIIGRMNGWLSTNALKLLTLECGSGSGGGGDGGGADNGQWPSDTMQLYCVRIVQCWTTTDRIF